MFRKPKISYSLARAPFALLLSKYTIFVVPFSSCSVNIQENMHQRKLLMKIKIVDWNLFVFKNTETYRS